MAVQLHPHQVKAVKEMHNGCVLKGGVGTGKTITALYYFYTRVVLGVPAQRVPTSLSGRLGSLYQDSTSTRSVWAGPSGDHVTTEVQRPTRAKDLVVITTARKRDSLDWQGDAARFAISTVREHSYGGIELTVDSWNNIEKYKNRRDCFFIFDEQRLVGSGAWVKAFLAIAKTNEWIMLSATPGDSWMDYIPVFIANGFYKNRTEFLRRHVVYNNFSKFPKIDHYVEEARLAKLRHQVVVDMPYARHTTRHLHNVVVQYDKELFDLVKEKRWNVFEKRPIRDVGEMFVVMRKLVNSDMSRLEAIRELLVKHPKLIVFYNFDYELHQLRKLEFRHHKVAEWNGHKHEEVPEGDSWVYLVQYAAGAEAWNCVETDAMAFYSLTYSYKIFEQSQGRIDRLNTPYSDLHFYLLRSGAWIDQVIMKALRAKRTFSEREAISSKN